MPITQNQSPESCPRHKLLTGEAGALSDTELLASFLGNGLRGRTAMQIARGALANFGGLRGLLGAGHEEFCQQAGLGAGQFARIQAALELSRRYAFAEMRAADAMNCPGLAENYLMRRIGDLGHEVFCVLFLDSQHRVIRCEEMFRGTLDAASVYPREVVKRALHHNAAALILAHNHPSGVAEPSSADRRITERLIQALGLVDIRVLDHLVIGHGAVVSFSRRGLL